MTKTKRLFYFVFKNNFEYNNFKQICLFYLISYFTFALNRKGFDELPSVYVN